MAQISLNSTGVASTGALSLQSNGTTEAIGISTGQVATFAQNPVLTSGTTNGLAYLNGSKVLTTNSALQFDGSNLGLGVTPSAWNTVKAFQFGNASVYGNGTADASFSQNAFYQTGWKYIGSAAASQYQQNSGAHAWYNAPSGTAGNAISFTQAMTLDASGNLLVGATSSLYGERITASAIGKSTTAFLTDTATEYGSIIRNTASSGNNGFILFQTESGGSATTRGSITYNRAGGLTAYNTTSDYRAKDIYGEISDSGSVIDSTPVYMGKMKGATQERPMFIAHETPSYAHIGEKDAVDADGKPVYQQMDASALIPVMWAEIQSLRKRLAAAGI